MHRSHARPRPSAARATAARAEVTIRLVLLVAAIAAAALLTLFAARAGAMAAHQEAAREPQTAAAPAPSPQLSADDVVVIVLDALARNDTPVKDRGISVTFAFASPANRAFIGPVDRFAEVVRDATYRPLLYHRNAARGATRVDGQRATERVVITTASGQRVAYVFTLSLQTDGPYKGCWMTDGVTREPSSPLAGMQSAD